MDDSYPWMDGQWIYVQVSLIPHGWSLSTGALAGDVRPAVMVTT